ncbi:response regulator [Pseudomonas aeruginosa]|nr:response regulator [Pseudomonas aeruginosa]
MHVLLTEDDDLIASGIVAGLNAQGLTVDRVASAADTQALLQVARFDVLVLDLGLPDEDGLRLLQRLRQQGVDLPVLVLTARDAVTDRVAGLQAGADDYLLKPFDLRELGARLHTLQRRSAGRCVNVIEHGRLSYDPSTRETWLDGRPVELSRREQALLQALLNNRGRILSGEQLKDSVYGFGDEVESNALNVHIHHLRRKLGNAIVQTVRHFLQGENLRLDNLLFDNGGQLGQQVGSVALPTTVFYTAEGRLLGSHLGELSRGSLARYLEAFEPAAAASATRSSE